MLYFDRVKTTLWTGWTPSPVRISSPCSLNTLRRLWIWESKRDGLLFTAVRWR